MDAELFPRRFAIGSSSTRQGLTPQKVPKYCKKCKTPIIKYTQPLLCNATNITNDEHATLIWCGPTLTDRFNKIQRLNNPKFMLDLNKEECRIRCDILFKEQHIRTTFRNFVRIWLHNHYKGRFLNTEDPATMEVPRNPIRVYDTKQKGTYVFEASSLFKSTEKDLSYAQWLFPEPSHPKNPLTNLVWKLGQRLHIIQQFRSLNMGSWMIESYNKLHFNLRTFRDLFMVPLKIHALNDLSRNPSNEHTIDFVSEFMEDMIEHFETETITNLALLKWASCHMYTHPYIASWRDTWVQIYRYKIMYGEEYLDNHPILQTKLYKQAEKLLYDFKSIAELAEERLARIPKHNRVHKLSDSDSDSDSDSESKDNEGEGEAINTLHMGPIHIDTTLRRVIEFQAARRIQALTRGWLSRRDRLPGLVEEQTELTVWPIITTPLPNVIIHLNNIQTMESFTERLVELLEKVYDDTQDT